MLFEFFSIMTVKLPGQSLVVWAIMEGNECANEVNEYLMKDFD